MSSLWQAKAYTKKAIDITGVNFIEEVWTSKEVEDKLAQFRLLNNPNIIVIPVDDDYIIVDGIYTDWEFVRIN